MNQPPSFVLRAILGWKGHLSVPRHKQAWPCFISSMPDVDTAKKTIPADALCLYDMEGGKQGRLMKTGEVLQSYRVQVKTRSADYQAGWAKANAIALEMDKVKRLGIDAGNYLYLVHAITRDTVTYIGQRPDEKRLYEFVINCSFNACESTDQNFGTNDTIYDSQGELYELVHVDFPAWFGISP